MKKLLINGAGRGYLGIIKAAKNVSAYTIVTVKAGQCLLGANTTYPEVHPDEVLKVAEQEDVDGFRLL